MVGGSDVLPRLRAGLDLMPSPVPDRPGLLMRDPFGYAQGVLIVPPPLVACLAYFDGERTEADLRVALHRITGEIQVGELLRHLVDSLATGGFLENEAFAARRDEHERSFAAAPRREAAHAGSAYPADREALARQLATWMAGKGGETRERLLGIAAPHVSPAGGVLSYAAAYAALPAAAEDKVFVILGTSHYGAPNRYGLTRKPFATPLGETRVELDLIDRLAAAGPALVMEDYCHAVEHSIEFQVLFLQHRYGAAVRIVPILCGPLLGPELPESEPGVARFLEALASETARRDDLLWVLGVDMAHLGSRYGDRFAARAGEGALREVERRDRERLERIAAGDAEGFWGLVSEGGADALRWCGTAPLYTFLRAARPGRGSVLDYAQWNIDETSVVSFAGLVFESGA